ncbi:MAG: NYN domain-containing protein [Christensenellaceae bacterium]|jgi:hypothetical protein|nr:NYN domain-containing protein [Christensenellaceae bacterium]
MRQTAILIDGDNINPSNIDIILKSICNDLNSNPVFKGVYGDFSKPLPKKWLEISKTYSLSIRHESALKGKNSTDIALVIDAMDFLYTKPNIEAFCLVTSDKDFIRLIDRLRIDGKFVIGAFEEKACMELQNSYDYCIHLPINTQPTATKTATKNTQKKNPNLTKKVEEKAVKTTPPQKKEAKSSPPPTKNVLSNTSNKSKPTTPANVSEPINNAVKSQKTKQSIDYPKTIIITHMRNLLDSIPNKTLTFSNAISKLNEVLPGLKPQKSKNYEENFYLSGPSNARRISLIFQ